MGKFKDIAIELEETKKLKTHLDELENYGMAHEIKFLEKENQVTINRVEEEKIRSILKHLKRFNEINIEDHKLIEKALSLFLGEY
tara:strand:- start:893 stop:1147 length:255 start_codon:yes stop_codon:yes gene_type:complete